MLDYPAWFTALDRTRIEQARSEHGPFQLDAREDRFFVIYDVRYPSDADARTAVLAVLQVVAGVLTPYYQHRAWADAARHLRDALIVDIDRYRPYDTWPTLELFAAAIEQALTEETWWPAVPQHAVLPTSRAPRSREAYPKRAVWLKEQLQLAGNPSRHRLRVLGGPDAKTIQRILNGRHVHDDVLEKLRQALNEAGCRVDFDEIPPN